MKIGSVTKPPMAYFGGKTRLAQRIAALLPPHEHYVEPFAGSLAVLLAKPPSRLETVNDLDNLLMTFWRVLRDKPSELQRVCLLTPHSRAEYLEARSVDFDDLDDVEGARLVWLQIAQGRGGTLRKTGWRTYIDPAGTNASMPEYLISYVNRMAVAAERLQHVSLECRPALEIIESYGRHPKVCLYVDPPYIGSSRGSSGGNGYRVEMLDTAAHEALLAALCAFTTQGAGIKQARTEVLWSNRPISGQGSFNFNEEAN